MVDLVTPCQGDNYSAQQGCFEGPEKLLEVWFSPSAHQFADHQDLDYYNSSSEDDGSSNNDDEDKADAIARFSPPRPHRHGEYPTKHTGLRVVPRPVWDDMLALVKCTVLNVITNEHVDAYLLSESSMFVYPHKLILKTCGTTTLLFALPQLLQIARQYCGFEKVWRVFYSRKAFMFPERQIGPHRSWDSEVEFLNKCFDNGSAYTIGKVKTDQWHLYLTKPADDVLHHNGTTSPLVLESRQSTPSCEVNNNNNEENGDVVHREIINSGQITPVNESNPSPFGSAHTYPDQTVEICMRRLNPEKMQQGFYHNSNLTESGTVGGQFVDQLTGIGALYPKAQLDSFLFEPCGYSSNGLQDDRYFTIHVTPEPDCSYASFETNIPVEESHACKNTADGDSPIERLVNQVTRIFDPESFTVTFFTSHHHKDKPSHSHMVHSMVAMAGGYKRTHRILYEFDGYDLVYGHYTKDSMIEQ